MPKEWGPLSAHKNQGWSGQYDRMKRWHVRLKELGREPSVTSDDSLDMAFAFFQNCYHLRDWLLASSDVDRASVERFFESQTQLQVCRDICNGTKHCDISRASVDTDFVVGREYAPNDWFTGPSYPNDERWFVIAGTDLYDILKLADDCLRLWEEFLTTQGLLKR